MNRSQTVGTSNQFMNQGREIAMETVKRTRWSVVLLSFAMMMLICLIDCTTVSAQDGSSDRDIRARQAAQSRARRLARELLSNILDTQLKQLEINGLQQETIYNDIRTMRANIETLVENEMNQVVELLADAQEADAAGRQQKIVEARRLIRRIIIQLSVERRKLLRRLKAAEITELVRQLIRLETAVQDKTKRVPSETPGRREELALTLQEDQRDINKLFLNLLETLADVSRWDGPLATGAAKGIRILAAAETGLHLDETLVRLETAQYTAAVVHEQKVIDGLRQLLRVVERAQGLIGTERQQLLAKVRELQEEQTELREKTEKTDLAKMDAVKELVEEQTEIQKELAELAGQLTDEPRAETHLQQAQEAAEQATMELFEGNKEEAAKDQGQTLGHLSALEELLEDMANGDSADKSADELAKTIEDLEAAREDVKAAQEKQAEASAKADEKTDEAAKAEAEVAKKTEEAAKERELPENVENRLAEATDAAKAAEEALKEATNAEPESDEQAAKEQAVETAEEALERAAAEIEATLAEAKRKQLAVKVGELARAAESLERAAAVEREIARKANDAAKENGLQSEDTDDLQADQNEVDEIAEKVAEGVKQTAPEAAKALEESKKKSENLKAALAKAKDAPGEDSKPAAKNIAEEATAMANELSKAADALREEIGETANELVAVSDEQLKAVSPVREAVENALNERPDSLSERIQRLEDAKTKTATAEIEQQKANGRPEAAEAMELAGQIAEAQHKQDAADQSAKELANGNAATPLDATANQQEVADALQDAKKQAESRAAAQAKKEAGEGDELSETLAKAQQAAAEAAKQTLEGNREAAKKARDEAREALKQAAELAQTEAQAATAAEPTGEPDAEAQQQVAKNAGEAGELAQMESGSAAEKLAQAQQQAEKAADALANENTEAAKPAQVDAGKALADAKEAIDSALKNLTEQQNAQMEQQAEQAMNLAQQAANVDPGATSALREAAQSAKPMPTQPMNAEAVANTDKAVQEAMERAVANLAAQEQQIAQDKAIAQALADLAKKQQDAAEQIAANRQPVNEPAKPIDPNLARALQLFAQAQRATGQGAAQIAGQEEIANQPIREALELASNLNPFAPPEGTPMPTDPSNPAGEPGQTPPAGEGTPTGQPMPGQPGQTPTGQGDQPAVAQAIDPNLGTGFVPNSPELTAQMMAGPQAAQMAAASPTGQPTPGQPMPGQPGQTPAAQPTPGVPTASVSPVAIGGSTSIAGLSAENDGLKDGPLDASPVQNEGDSRTGNSTKDSDAESRRFRRDTWLTKLPPEIRNAIRSGTTMRAPRAYEERLKRYFESIE